MIRIATVQELSVFLPYHPLFMTVT